MPQRPDPVKESRVVAEREDLLHYFSAAYGVEVVVVPASKPVILHADPELDKAILILKAKAPEAFEVFLARAIRKYLVYNSAEAADPVIAQRRAGAVSVAVEVGLLVDEVEQRVERRDERDARRRARAAKQPSS